MSQYYITVTYILSCIIGLCVGSFLNVVIYRLPEGMNLAKPGSHCTSCGYELKWYDNIPVISYIILGGRCRKCREHISVRYTVVEIANALLWLACALLFVPGNIPYAAACALACSVMICVFFIDLEHMIVPDSFQIILLVLGIIVTIFDRAQWLSHVIGCAAGFLSFLLIALVAGKLAGREALGGGDIKLAGVMGLFLGWQRLLLAVLLASVIGSIVILALQRGENKGKEFPFAPFLSSAFVFAGLFGDKIIDLYLSLLI